ncbi:MAG: methyl-accepting chemotaxis protein, partial [Clostridiales Family XIII bacterium]|nr:methyl-accepting chemotaxis protein [Clostridiales Family XIII bacterium]
DAASGNVAHEYLATEEVQASVTFTAFCYGAVALIGAVVIAFVFTIFSLRPMRDLAKRIERFVEGDFTVDGMVSAKGDLGKISRAVTEMGVSLAIKRYETDRMIDSYARFVPRDADRLLDRAGIMEICTGDIAEIDECIAIVSVENRVAVMREMDSHGFMTFVNSCFTRILEFAGKRGGTLLSGEFLESLPILFSRRLGAKKADAIRFGLDLIDRMSGGESDVPAPDFFLLLHKTDFLYGIAGTDKKSFPFISSAELNFLFGCNAPLRQLGIRMAATEQYLDSLTEDGSSGVADAYAKRHIGKITFADESRDYRLYEMLDCLSDRERDLRLNYDKRFQAAIDLFYRDAFYVAMVEFSSILKINPHDGLARWYAFACERYFDEGDHAKVRHQLLGFEGI